MQTRNNSAFGHFSRSGNYKILKNLRVHYFNDLKSKNCEDKEKFWTTVKFTFSNKNKAANVATPMERIDQYEGSFPNCNVLIALGSSLVLLAQLTI